MPKRKASSPIDMNGDEGSDEVVGNSGGDGGTPKRSYPPEASPSKLELKGELTNFADDLSSHFRSLNQSFVASIHQAVAKDPSVCLVPIAQDYVSHSQTLMTKYQTCGSSGLNTSVLSLQNSDEFSKMEKFLRERNISESKAIVPFTTQQPQQHQQSSSASRLKNGIISKISVPSSTSSATTFFGSRASIGTKGIDDGYKPNPTSPINTSSLGRPPAVDSMKAKPTPPKTTEAPFKNFTFGTIPSSDGHNIGSFPMFGSASSTPATTSNENAAKPGGAISSSFFGNMSPIGSNSTATPALSGFNSKTEGSGNTMTPASSASGGGGTGFFQPFSFKPIVPPTSQADSGPNPASADNNDQEGGESDEPPKNEFKPVVEDDALYSVRCKIFGMLKGGFKDKGVGQLFVKKLEDSEKHQVVVRADNNLGTILLNVLLKEELPLKKKSAKDVLTVDPTGDDGKPLTILIRVKNEEAADELLEKLQHYAKQ